MEESRQRLLSVIKHLRYAVAEAAKGGKVQLGILSVKPDGSGNVVARMEVKEFVDDLAKALGAPEYTQADELDAAAKQFMDVFDLRSDQ
jgi:hypothetical protein